MKTKKYTAKEVKEITTKEITNFVRRYNRHVKKVIEENKELGIKDIIKPINKEDIIFNKVEYKETNGKFVYKEISTNRQIAAKLNMYSKLFDKKGKQVVKFGEVETIRYIKDRIKENERKIKRKEKQNKKDNEEFPLKPLYPISKESLKMGYEVRKRRTEYGRESAKAELYKRNYLKAVLSSYGGNYLEKFEEIISKIPVQKTTEILKKDERICIDYIYRADEVKEKADYILSVWGEYIDK